MKFPLPEAALAQHIGIVGKTGAGKSTTAKGAVEHIVRTMPGARVCILDPVKSDWWGLTSSANGARPGLPFHILGGPRGHVPLHPSAGKAIGELVGTGALPLSIIDMADFPAGGLSQFFNDFAPTLMRHARGVVYLVMEEAHEFAPKERAGIGAETMAIYYAKKLATAGRSKGIRLVVLTQRTQALHNALLGSCDTIIAHRLTAPADQDPIKAWLKAHVDKATFEKVAGSMASLPTGTAWVCSGEAQLAEQVHFPRISTFDNSATPMIGGQLHDVKTAPVDRDKLRTIIGSAVEKAEADHLPTLKARIADLEKKLAAKPTPPAAAPGKTVNAKPEQLEAARKRGWDARGRHDRDLLKAALVTTGNVDRRLGAISVELSELMATTAKLLETLKVLPDLPADDAPPVPAPTRLVTAATYTSPPGPLPVMHATAVTPREGLTGPMQRILDALAWWRAVGIEQPERVQVATVARYSATSTSFTNPLSALRTAGLIDYPPGGTIALTAEGLAKANQPESSPTTAELHARIFKILDGPRRRILEPLLLSYPHAMTREHLGEAANYSPTSTSFTNPLSGLRSLGLIDYRQGGQVVALPILFVEGR